MSKSNKRHAHTLADYLVNTKWEEEDGLLLPTGEINPKWTPDPEHTECVVCGNVILGQPFQFVVEEIKLNGNAIVFFCHGDPCKKEIEEAGRTGRWQDLPNGPLKDIYKNSIAKATRKRKYGIDS